MSSGLAPPPSLPPETPVVVPPPTEYEHFIDQRLTRTRRQVKGVDVAGGLVTLAVGVLGYLFAAAMVDHWLVVGGLGFWGRLLLWTRTGRRGGDLFRPPRAAAASAPHQSGLRRRNDREEPADAEEQPDQLPALARPASGSGRPRLSGHGIPAPRPICRKSKSRRPLTAGIWFAWAACWPRSWPCSASIWFSRRRTRSARSPACSGRGRRSKRPRG